MQFLRRQLAFVSDKALAVGITLTPAASALPLTGRPPRELDEIDTVVVSRKALAAGSSIRVTDRIVAMIGELSLSGTALAAGDVTGPVASAIPLTWIGELSQ